MIEATTMLVIGDHQKCPLPGRCGAYGVIDRGDQLLAIEHVVRRMLIVRDLPKEATGIVTRLDKAVVRQPSQPGMARELRFEQAKMRRDLDPEVDQGRRLRQIVEIDLPAMAMRVEAAKDRRHRARPAIGKGRSLVVDMTSRRSAMGEIAVGPSLARRRGMPAIGYAEGPSQAADDG